MDVILMETTVNTVDTPAIDIQVTLKSALPVDGGWVVILYNCDCHTFEDVEGILQIATKCTRDVAEFFAWKVHLDGRAIVFRSGRAECERVASIIGSVGLQVETDQG